MATVDDKAQKASGLAGILIAIAFALVKPDALDTLQQRYGTVPLMLLYLSLLLFLACILICLTAMWLRSVPVGGISVQAQEPSARLLLSMEVIDDELMAAYLENQLYVWKDLIKDRHTANIEKTELCSSRATSSCRGNCGVIYWLDCDGLYGKQKHGIIGASKTDAGSKTAIKSAKSRLTVTEAAKRHHAYF